MLMSENGQTIVAAAAEERARTGPGGSLEEAALN